MAPDRPVDIAVIGAGNRSSTIYQGLFQSLRPWVNVVAVCDPVKEHADRYADAVDAHAFYALDELIGADLVEAALVVAPIDVHHAISVTLSRAGVHHLVETSIASTLWQARNMVQVADEHGVKFRVGENFIRFHFDRISKEIDKTGFIGPVGRILCLHDHPGYHNNSRWLAFYGAHPETAQAIDHRMPVEPHWEAPHRYHEDEGFRCHFFRFPDNRLVTDLAGNIKGMLGRYPRPGYTELAGTRGAIVRAATEHWHGAGEVRWCSDDALKNGARHDHVFPIEHVVEDDQWICDRVELPGGPVEFRNPNLLAVSHPRAYYLSSVASHVTDFANEVRGSDYCEFTPADAVMSMEMEVGCRESMLRNGQEIPLPLTDLDIEAERRVRDELQAKHGVDPHDAEAMMGIMVARP